MIVSFIKNWNPFIKYKTNLKNKDKTESFPTTYFIGIDGQPLELLAGSVNEDELFSKIQKAIEVEQKVKIKILIYSKKKKKN